MPEFATGTAAPFWPLPSIPKRVATFGGKAFGAARRRGKRHHAGVDMLAPRGAEVVAPESGTIVATQRFTKFKTGATATSALLLQTDSGPVILLGEVIPGSWNQYAAGIGSRVEGGQVVAQVGTNPGGSTMLHYEMYTEGTSRNRQWFKGATPPPELLDPTQYLETAAAGQPITPVPSDDTDHEHPEEPATTLHPPPGDDDMPDDAFDPVTPVTPDEVWVNKPMTPADNAAWQADGQRPIGRWNQDQKICTQKGGTYVPRESWGTGPHDSTGDCVLPDGTRCPTWELMTGRCPGTEVPEEEIPPETDVVDEVETEGDEIDPWVLLPDIFPNIPKLPFGVPWWVGALAAGALLWVVTSDNKR